METIVETMEEVKIPIQPQGIESGFEGPEELKIEIRPIPNRDGIKKFSSNLEYFSQSHIISPFVDSTRLKYRTGLSADDIHYLKVVRKFPYDISDDYVKGVPHPFWESHLVKTELRNTPTFLFPSKSDIDFVRWKYLTVNDYIYRSQEELKTGCKPQTTHFIYNEEIENEIKATKVQRRNKVIRKISELSLSRKRDLILVLLNETTENKNEDYLTVRFEDVLANPKQFDELETLLSAKAEMVSLSAMIKSAIYKNILKRTKEGIFLYESNLGFREDDVREFLAKPENQEILLTIKAKIQ